MHLRLLKVLSLALYQLFDFSSLLVGLVVCVYVYVPSLFSRDELHRLVDVAERVHNLFGLFYLVQRLLFALAQILFSIR